jgi:hypothetical protein
MKKIYILFSLMVMASLSGLSQSKEVEVTATMDNTIFKDTELSNGAGQYVFTGTTRQGVTKRALVMFDLNSKLPEDAMVDSAQLILVPSKVKPASTDIKIYRVATEWGEGSSEAEDGDGKGDTPTKNDATWTFSKFNTDRWVKKGGDFAVLSSDTTTVTLGEDAIFSSSAITEDVKFWLENPTMNFGWIFIGDEANSSTSVKFVSKDHTDNSLWPTLKIYYQSATSAPQLADTGLDLKVYQGADMSKITISNTGDPGVCSMEVFSITGIRVYSDQFQLSEGSTQITTGIQEPGIYVYRIRLNQKSSSGKLLFSNQ